MKNRFSLLMVMLAMSLTVILTSNTTANAATTLSEKIYATTDLGDVPVPDDIPIQGNIGIHNLGECNNASPGLGQVNGMVISDLARSCAGQNYFSYICSTSATSGISITSTAASGTKLICWTHSSPISARSCAWKMS